MGQSRDDRLWGEESDIGEDSRHVEGLELCLQPPEIEHEPPQFLFFSRAGQVKGIFGQGAASLGVPRVSGTIFQGICPKICSQSFVGLPEKEGGGRSG